MLDTAFCIEDRNLYAIINNKTIPIESIRDNKVIAESVAGTEFKRGVFTLISLGNGKTKHIQPKLIDEENYVWADEEIITDFSKYLKMDLNLKPSWIIEHQCSSTLYMIQNNVLIKNDLLLNEVSAVPMLVVKEASKLTPNEKYLTLYCLSEKDYIQAYNRGLENYGFTNIESFWCTKREDNSIRIEILDSITKNNGKSFSLCYDLYTYLINRR